MNIVVWINYYSNDAECWAKVWNQLHDSDQRKTEFKFFSRLSKKWIQLRHQNDNVQSSKNIPLQFNKMQVKLYWVWGSEFKNRLTSVSECWTKYYQQILRPLEMNFIMKGI